MGIVAQSPLKCQKAQALKTAYLGPCQATWPLVRTSVALCRSLMTLVKTMWAGELDDLVGEVSNSSSLIIAPLSNKYCHHYTTVSDPEAFRGRMSSAFALGAARQEFFRRAGSS